MPQTRCPADVPRWLSTGQRVLPRCGPAAAGQGTRDWFAARALGSDPPTVTSGSSPAAVANAFHEQGNSQGETNRPEIALTHGSERTNQTYPMKEMKAGA